MLRLALTTACALALAGLAAVPGLSSAGDTAGVYTFVSEPGLHPPKLDLLVRRPGLAPGDFLLTGGGDYRGGHRVGGQPGPMIVDSRLQPVWFGGPRSVFDFGQESYRGRPVLVMLAPQSVLVLSEQYRTIATLTVRSPWMIDGHDASMVGGNIWVVVTRALRNQNLTRYGGPRRAHVLDCGLQEYRLATRHLIRTWDARGPGGKPNVPLSASELPPGSGGRIKTGDHLEWDPYHLNSVQALPDGDVLISMRDTWAVYLLNPVTGHVVWTLGGKNSTFSLGRRAHFDWQHDAELVSPEQGGIGRNVELTLFNDNNGRAPARPSSGMVFRLNTVTRKATLLRAYRHHPALRAVVEGSMQLLPGGNALVGWGSEPYFSEYSKAGRLLLDARLPLTNSSYRALLTDTWVGTPYYPPRGAVRGQTVYASWNGATQVASWQVLAGQSAGALKLVGTGTRTGFETAVPLGHTYAYYEVRALGADGRVLGTSKAFS
jgi:hypothetical protein